MSQNVSTEDILKPYEDIGAKPRMADVIRLTQVALGDKNLARQTLPTDIGAYTNL